MKIFNLPISRALDFVAIDLYANTLKLLHLKNYPDRREIKNLKIQNIASLPDEDIFKIIDNFLLETQAKKPYIIGVIPSYLVITKNIEIPSIDPKEIREIVNLQAARHTPYSHEEIAVDFINLGSFKRNYTQIILLIV
ncbi:MAG: hypothetical protein N2Z79_01215, partial [Candidatus Omnitrophica bacterium]|nr:hypothetical protein [Candidatus Omnitrophota bacterium]